MTGKFWSSFFYETTLYNLLVKRKNIYLEQKKKLLDISIYNNKSNKIKLIKKDSPETEDKFYFNKNIIFNSYIKKDKKQIQGTNNYTSYCSWFLNRFCKLFYDNKEAYQKRQMIVSTLGLNNYLLHLDYIDRQIILEQQTGETDKIINDIIEKNKIYSNLDNDNTALEFQKELKGIDFSFMGEHYMKNNMKYPLTLNN